MDYPTKRIMTTIHNNLPEALLLVEDNTKYSLRLYTYNQCDDNDPDEIKINRSVIKDYDDNIVSRSLPYTKECETPNDAFLVHLDWEKYEICPSIEGTLVRLFYHGNTWILSTNRKIDAFTSYWSCRLSFGQLFVDHLTRNYPNHENHVLEYFYSKLDQSNTYFFLIQNNFENRVVCHSDDPKLYYIGKYVNNDWSVLDRAPFDEQGSIPMVKNISESIRSKDDMVAFIKGHVLPFETQGVILFNKEKNEQIKIYHPQYRKYWKVRNNVPNLQLRYLQIRLTPEEEVADFFVLYPKFRIMADKMENGLLEITRTIYHAYVNRFIRKQYVSIPRDLYHILKIAHEWHLQDRTNNKIYFQKIASFVNEQDPRLLLTILRKLFKEKREAPPPPPVPICSVVVNEEEETPAI